MSLYGLGVIWGRLLVFFFPLTEPLGCATYHEGSSLLEKAKEEDLKEKGGKIFLGFF